MTDEEILRFLITHPMRVGNIIYISLSECKKELKLDVWDFLQKILKLKNNGYIDIENTHEIKFILNSMHLMLALDTLMGSLSEDERIEISKKLMLLGNLLGKEISEIPNFTLDQCEEKIKRLTTNLVKGIRLLETKGYVTGNSYMRVLDNVKQRINESINENEETIKTLCNIINIFSSRKNELDSIMLNILQGLQKTDILMFTDAMLNLAEEERELILSKASSLYLKLYEQMGVVLDNFKDIERLMDELNIDEHSRNLLLRLYETMIKLRQIL